ncbi:hypothetical protein ASC95_26550 [Pelomonas sp. Root1217]|nr:hypothetical protein ASC95_26550 [Pelomonas sp. Root1217]
MLLSLGLMAVAAPPALAVDAAPAVGVAQHSLTLPLKPSEMLRAPLAVWKPVLDEAATVLAKTAGQAASLGNAALVDLHIRQALLAQTRRDWPAVLAAVEKARAAQGGEAGRQTAGLLNAMLARKALSRGDDTWLRYHLRDAVLAMPWADVEPTILSFRDQLAKVQADQVEAFVVDRLDAPASVTRNQVDLGFLFQLLGVRFQLLEVMPSRAALVAGLDDAIARRRGAK